jgi:hypothetical protein
MAAGPEVVSRIESDLAEMVRNRDTRRPAQDKIRYARNTLDLALTGALRQILPEVATMLAEREPAFTADWYSHLPSPPVSPMTESAATTPAWMEAIAPYVERADYRVPLKTPIHLLSGKIIHDVAGVYMRFPRWQGDAFVDDSGRSPPG